MIKNITDAPIRVQKRNKEEVYKEAMELLRKWACNTKTPIHANSPVASASV
ncbi:MAG: hypothetical protein ACLT4E_14205 [Clostridium sp.]